MKTLIIQVLIAGFLLGCNAQPRKQDQSNEIIQTEKSLINEFYSNDTYQKKKYEFEVVESLLVDLNGNNVNDSIACYKVLNWDDSGDFQKILISLDTGQRFELVNFDGWTTINKDLIPKSFIKSNLLVGFKTYNGQNIILLNGYVYGSGYSNSTLIDFSTGKPRVIFNKELIFNTIDNINEVSTVFIGQTNEGEISLILKGNALTLKGKL